VEQISDGEKKRNSYFHYKIVKRKQKVKKCNVKKEKVKKMTPGTREHDIVRRMRKKKATWVG